MSSPPPKRSPAATPRNAFAGVARKLMSWALVLAATAFLWRVLAPQIALMRASIDDIRWPQIVLAIALAAPMFVLKGVYHLNLLDRISGVRRPRRTGLPIYLQAQIVRYLPGKVWGLVYQSQRMSDTHRASEVVIANLWQMATTNLLAAGLVLSVLLALRVSPLSLCLFVPAVVLVEWLHRHPAIETWTLRRLGRYLPKLAPLAATRPMPPMPWKGTALLCSEWIFYFLAFFALLYGRSGWLESLLLGTWYGGASLLALAAFVVPAGIAVREAIFVAAPDLTGASAATLAVTAALARIMFLGAEIAAAVLASACALAFRPSHERA